ncbi:hypothetical protein RRG08_032264 [Elysia crispata]|uniref:G-protein coupled receptors family 1 profile domain-containing protein n=1 Tax=Elysia crispata TaxID=231223 RepID=A0AAE1ATB8_9GAST|nr:hypothetical protein RRG08_032264 [Elysia crispata]
MASSLLTSFTDNLNDAHNISSGHVGFFNSSSSEPEVHHETSASSLLTTISSENIAAEHSVKPLIPKWMMIYIDIYSHIVVPFIVSSFGVVSNIVNLIIFTHLGLKDGMSVGLWCLSFSDLTVTGQTLGSSICSLCGLVLPRDTLVSPGLVHYVSLLWSQDMMYLVSNWITTFISLERCICVIWPFKVKSLFTRARSIAVIVIIFVVHVASYAPVFASHRLEIVKVKAEQQHLGSGSDASSGFPGLLNSFSSTVSSLDTSPRSFMSQTGKEGGLSLPDDSTDFPLKFTGLHSPLVFTQSPSPLSEEVGITSVALAKDKETSAGPDEALDPDIEAVMAMRSKKFMIVAFSHNRAVIHHTVDIINGAVLPVVQQALVIASAGGLAYGLKATSRVRTGGHAQKSDTEKGTKDEGETKQAQKSGLSQKEMRLVKVVAFLALILTICNIPRFIAVYTTLLIPEMHIGEAYENMYVFLWALTALFASVNASVNIFVYLTVNSAYRAHFKTLFWCFRQDPQTKEEARQRTEVMFLINFAFDPGEAFKPRITCTPSLYRYHFPCGPGSNFIDYADLEKCLHFVNVPETWRNAETKCAKMGGNLLTITSQDVADRISKSANISGVTWLGLERKFAKNAVWTTGEVFNGYRNLPPFKTNEPCVTLAQDKRSWTSSRCGATLPYYCEARSGRQLYTPTMIVKNTNLSTVTFEGGKNISAICEGFVGDFGFLAFLWTKGNVSKFYDVIHKEVDYLEERVYLMDGQRCGRLSTITLTMFATNFRSGWSLQCCAGKPAHQSACTDEVLVKVEYKDTKPNIAVKFHFQPSYVLSNWTLSASCDAYTGVSGTVKWYLLRPQTADLLLNSSETLHLFDLYLGRRHEHDIQLKIDLSHNMSRLACRTLTTSTESSPMQVLYSPKILDIRVMYHELPNHVHNGEILEANCSAYLGSWGWLTWELTTLTRTIVWSTQTNGLRVSDDRMADIHTTTVGKGPNLVGDKVNSSFSTKVDSEFMGARVGCRVRLPHGLATNLPEESTLERASRPLKVLYDSRSPSLQVDYHGPPPTVILHKVVAVTCSALVGTDGVLTLGLITPDSVSVWSVDTKGVLRGTNQEGVYLRDVTAELDRRLGPRVTAHMDVLITEEIESSKVYCFSYDAFSNFTGAASSQPLDHLGEVSLPFEVQELSLVAIPDPLTVMAVLASMITAGVAGSSLLLVYLAEIGCRKTGGSPDEDQVMISVSNSIPSGGSPDEDQVMISVSNSIPSGGSPDKDQVMTSVSNSIRSRGSPDEDQVITSISHSINSEKKHDENQVMISVSNSIPSGGSPDKDQVMTSVSNSIRSRGSPDEDQVITSISHSINSEKKHDENQVMISVSNSIPSRGSPDEDQVMTSVSNSIPSGGSPDENQVMTSVSNFVRSRGSPDENQVMTSISHSIQSGGSSDENQVMTSISLSIQSGKRHDEDQVMTSVSHSIQSGKKHDEDQVMTSISHSIQSGKKHEEDQVMTSISHSIQSGGSSDENQVMTSISHSIQSGKKHEEDQVMTSISHSIQSGKRHDEDQVMTSISHSIQSGKKHDEDQVMTSISHSIQSGGSSDENQVMTSISHSIQSGKKHEEDQVMTSISHSIQSGGSSDENQVMTSISHSIQSGKKHEEDQVMTSISHSIQSGKEHDVTPNVLSEENLAVLSLTKQKNSDFQHRVSFSTSVDKILTT